MPLKVEAPIYYCLGFELPKVVFMGEHQKVLHGRIENVEVVGKEVFYKRAVLCDLINLVPFVFDTIGKFNGIHTDHAVNVLQTKALVVFSGRL